MKKIMRKFLTLVWQPFVKKKIADNQWVKYKNIKILVKKGVFHPTYFYSTKFLLAHLQPLDLSQKTMLELGAGSGLISFYCAISKQALVTASDISSIVMEGLASNQKKLGSNISLVQSDLFDSIPQQTFDYMLINPPYYQKNPIELPDYAWYCGENLEYFQKLFKDLKPYLNQNSTVLMVLSEDCAIEKIKQIAFEKGFVFRLLESKTIFFEENYIFQINYENNASPNKI
jgi:release factor glutamine methyltransferase